MLQEPVLNWFWVMTLPWPRTMSTHSQTIWRLLSQILILSGSTLQRPTPHPVHTRYAEQQWQLMQVTQLLLPILYQSGMLTHLQLSSMIWMQAPNTRHWHSQLLRIWLVRPLTLKTEQLLIMLLYTLQRPMMLLRSNQITFWLVGLLSLTRSHSLQRNMFHSLQLMQASFPSFLSMRINHTQSEQGSHTSLQMDMHLYHSRSMWMVTRSGWSSPRTARSLTMQLLM